VEIFGPVVVVQAIDDDVCPVNEPRSLANALKNARRRVQYLEFDGGHTIPAEIVRAVVVFATAMP